MSFPPFFKNSCSIQIKHLLSRFFSTPEASLVRRGRRTKYNLVTMELYFRGFHRARWFAPYARMKTPSARVVAERARPRDLHGSPARQGREPSSNKG